MRSNNRCRTEGRAQRAALVAAGALSAAIALAVLYPPKNAHAQQPSDGPELVRALAQGTVTPGNKHTVFRSWRSRTVALTLSLTTDPPGKSGAKISGTASRIPIESSQPHVVTIDVERNQTIQIDTTSSAPSVTYRILAVE